MKDLCQSFRYIAYSTDDILRRGAAIGFQHAEETITDNIIFSLSERHSSEIQIHTFSKRTEGVNGADWEWWLSNANRDQWLGMRIQAKVLDMNSRKFEHLHYKSGKAKEFQSTKLKREAGRAGLVPLYCLYSFHVPRTLYPTKMCRTFPYTPEFLGCSLVSVSNVEALRSTSSPVAYTTVMKHAVPWHCLVCCQGYSGSSLPERAWNWLNAQELFTESSSIDGADTQEPENTVLGVKTTPPNYVLNIINGESSVIDTGNEQNIKGIVVITESDQG